MLAPRSSEASTVRPAELTRKQDRLLDEIEGRAANFFYTEADPQTGLVRDRAVMNGVENRRVSSIAATGFGLSALAIADSRGYLADPSAAEQRVERTLEYLANEAPHEHGFFLHFVDVHSGERIWRCEYSSVDTAWLLCGALHAGAYFATPRIQSLARQIYERVDWNWMLHGGDTLSHGWTPERGFLPYRWDTYSELLAMYLLAIGSPTHPIPESSWDAVNRPMRKFRGVTYVESTAPLFAHQYSHAWFDFRGRRDDYADYFENSRVATEAHRNFCLELAEKFPWFADNLWGVTASDSRRGYLAWGDRARPRVVDGTLVPCAAGGSMPFMPSECASVLETMYEKFGGKNWGRYGFVDAFHPVAGWYDRDVVGIDVGIMMLMAENARSESVWNTMMTEPVISNSMERVGLLLES